LITVISKFKVANQKSDEVEQAFHNRPHLVENAAGFHEIEVLRDIQDPSIFYLYTKWEDEFSYKSWHSSSAHHESHSRIPKGLKLDAAYTKVEILRDADAVDREIPGSLLNHFLTHSQQIYYFRLDQEGRVQSCSPAVSTGLGVSAESMIGRNICDFLAVNDAISFPERLKSGGNDQEFMLNIVSSDLSPFTVRTRLFVRKSSSVLIAERDIGEETIVSRAIVDLNNELIRLTRENQQKNLDLTKAKDALTLALAERDKSYWYIKKIQEVLPICVNCQKVKSSDTSWENLKDFVLNNTDFLSHSYCPECMAKYKKGDI